MQLYTRFYGPTDTTGAKIVVRGGGRQRTWHYDYASVDPHLDAAMTLAEALGFERPRLTAVSESGAGVVFNVEEDM